MRIDINVHTEPVERALGLLSHELEDWDQAWDKVRDDFIEMENARFAAQPWDPHGPLYRQWEDPKTGGHYPGGPVLGDGGLRASLTTPEVALEKGALHLVLGTRYRADNNVGRSVPVAALLHEGFVARGHIYIKRGATGYARPRIATAVPARPLYELTAGDKVRWAKHVEVWVGEQIAKVGL